MPKFLSLIFTLLFAASMQAQLLKLSGNLKDTSGAGGTVPNTLMMVARFSDSTLVAFSRSNLNGIFSPVQVPLDTYLVIISHPKFSDRTFLLVPAPSDTAFI